MSSAAAIDASGTTRKSNSELLMGSPGVFEGDGSPVVDGAVRQPVHGQVRLGVLERRGGVLVELDTQAGCVARVQEAAVERVRRAEHLQGGLVVRHVLLDAEVVDRHAQV